MHFVEKYRAWREEKGISHEQAMWIHVVGLAFYLYVIICFYTAGIRGLFEPKFVNIAIGYVSMFLILLSMGMSSICYFWNFADRYLMYRKHFGIVGFIYAAMHFGLSLLLVQKWVGLPAFFANPKTPFPFTTGLISLLVLAFMTVISHRLAIRYLGGPLWRALLRGGYLAIIFAVLHTAARKGEVWWLWVTGQANYILPPMGLLVFVAMIVVLGLRVGMEIDIRRKRGRGEAVRVPQMPTSLSVPTDKVSSSETKSVEKAKKKPRRV